MSCTEEAGAAGTVKGVAPVYGIVLVADMADMMDMMDTEDLEGMPSKAAEAAGMAAHLDGRVDFGMTERNLSCIARHVHVRCRVHALRHWDTSEVRLYL